MDDTLLQILERLEPGGIGGVNQISDIINNQFPPQTNKRDFDIQRKRIIDFLTFISDDIQFDKAIDGQITTFDNYKGITKWVNEEMRVTLTNIGLKHLDEHRLLVSTIQLNESTLRNNGIISANTTTQSRVFIFQSIVFAVGAIFAFGSLDIAFKTYNRDDKTKELQLEILHLRQDSILSHNKLSQLKAIPMQVQIKHDTIYIRGAKK